MKKTLLALATLSAMAGSAFAADVTVYGLVDYGFQFKHVDQYTQTGDDNTFQMKSGMNSGSRFGLKGSEDLGNGLRSVSYLKTASAPTTARSTTAVVCSAVNRNFMFKAPSARCRSVESDS